MSTLRTANKIRMPRRSPVEPLSYGFGRLSGQMLRPIAKVNDALRVIERPTEVDTARALVAAIGRNGCETRTSPRIIRWYSIAPREAPLPTP